MTCHFGIYREELEEITVCLMFVCFACFYVTSAVQIFKAGRMMYDCLIMTGITDFIISLLSISFPETYIDSS